jgi:hypothetical protein
LFHDTMSSSCRLLRRLLCYLRLLACMRAALAPSCQNFHRETTTSNHPASQIHSSATSTNPPHRRTPTKHNKTQHNITGMQRCTRERNQHVPVERFDHRTRRNTLGRRNLQSSSEFPAVVPEQASQSSIHMRDVSPQRVPGWHTLFGHHSRAMVPHLHEQHHPHLHPVVVD